MFKKDFLSRKRSFFYQKITFLSKFAYFDLRIRISIDRKKIFFGTRKTKIATYLATAKWMRISLGAFGFFIEIPWAWEIAQSPVMVGPSKLAGGAVVRLLARRPVYGSLVVVIFITTVTVLDRN